MNRQISPRRKALSGDPAGADSDGIVIPGATSKRAPPCNCGRRLGLRRQEIRCSVDQHLFWVPESTDACGAPRARRLQGGSTRPAGENGRRAARGGEAGTRSGAGRVAPIARRLSAR